MPEPTQPSPPAGSTGERTTNRRPTWQTRVLRCRSWLREISTQMAWLLISRHGYRHSYCPVYRTNLAVLLHGLDRDIALSHICAPVHCYSRTVLLRESAPSSKRPPLLTR